METRSGATYSHNAEPTTVSEPRRYELLRDQAGFVRPLGTPGAQGGVFVGRRGADPQVAVKVFYPGGRTSATEEVVTERSACAAASRPS